MTCTPRLLTFVRLVFSVVIALPHAAQAETVVTTYVTKTQEERRSTRFTLDEWLRTKERMKLMDAWLAMVSDPKQRFKPEFHVEFAMKRGELTHTAPLTENTSLSTQADLVRGQLWLTNLISGTTGWRTLNVDLGVSGMYEELKKSSFLETLAPEKSSQFAAASFRIFGKNTQDSTLVLSYGRHRSSNNMFDSDSRKNEYTGVMVGSSLQVYLTSYLGVEGNFLRLGTNDSLASSASYSAYAYDYSGFIEVSLIRLQFGAYSEAQRLQSGDGSRFGFSDTGYFAGIKMFL